MDINTEALAYVSADGLAEVNNILTSSTATVDKDESLKVMNTSTA